MKTQAMKRYAMLLLLSITAPGMVNAATQNYTLYVESGSLTINGDGGTTMDAWGYTTQSGTSPVFPGPQLEANEGDTVNITVVNNHNINHNLVVKGLSESDQSSISSGNSHTYSFTASQAGTYVYRDNLNSDINRAMGLYGALIVRPSNGSQTELWSGGPSYDFERVWVIGGMDKARWNDVAGSGGNVNTSVYKPNYFIINGQGGFDGMHDANTTIAGNVGQTAAVRIVNGGQFPHSLHFHANHLSIVADDGTPRATSAFREVTTVNVPANSSVDIIYGLIQTGLYPMHNHTAQMETANGVYLNGVATMIDIQ